MKVETSWGECEIRGRTPLTQVHRDLLDCIMTYNTAMKPHGKDEVLVLFSQTHILDMYSNKSGTGKKNTKWLKSKIEELRDTTIKPIEKDRLFSDFNIFRGLIDASSEYGSYGVIFDKRYLDFFMKELTVNYGKILPELLRVENATFRSIIRWFLTHKKDQKFKVDTVLAAVGFPDESAQMLRKIKRELAENHAVFQQFGIEYDSDEKMFYYRGNEAVGFIPSLLKKQKTEAISGEVVPNQKKTSKSKKTSGYDDKKSLTQLLKGKKVKNNDGSIMSIERVEGTKEVIQIIFEDGYIDKYQNIDSLPIEKFKRTIYTGIISEEII